MTQQEIIQKEALDRAENGETMSNYPNIIMGFLEKGIPLDDIQPRENVFTYNAWRAKGRQVRRGEHGVRVMTIRHFEDEDTGKKRTRPWSATVFHISQTDPRE